MGLKKAFSLTGYTHLLITDTNLLMLFRSLYSFINREQNMCLFAFISYL